MKKEQQIHDATMAILRDVGIHFCSEEALHILKAHGIRVDGSIAYFSESDILP